MPSRENDAAGWHTEFTNRVGYLRAVTASKNDATVSINMGLDYRA